MGEGEWTEVRRKNRNSVFNRLKFPQHSNRDELSKISLTVYVSNFPSHLTVRELWNICGKKGTLADVFIAKHKNKLRQMFGFCRFIKVSNQEALIESLSNIWIGKLRLHANKARFDRFAAVKAGDKVVKPVNVNHRPMNNPSKSVSYAHVAKSQVGAIDTHSNGVKASINGGKFVDSDLKGSEDSPSSIFLDHVDGNDFPLALLGCYKDFRSIANSRILCRNEGFLDVGIKYLGGLWVLLEFSSTDARNKFLNHESILPWFSSLSPWHDDFVVKERLIWLEIEGVPLRAWHNYIFKKICERWGEMLFCDDSDGCNRLSKRLCIKSSHDLLVFATTFVVVKGVSYAIRVRELCSWTPTFVNDEAPSDDEDYMDAHDVKKENLFESKDAESIVGDDLENDGLSQFHEIFSPKNDDSKPAPGEESKVHGNEEDINSDPFNLDPLIKRALDKDTIPTSSTPTFPPGFAPVANDELQEDYASVRNDMGSESVHNHSQDKPQNQFGFSMIERLEETIKVGLALGFNMEGCEKTLASLIAENGDIKVIK
ncbi:reverse transcriptase domain, reverse transcriptase zinc-binding domain protein [Tanacetum coccineum]